MGKSIPVYGFRVGENRIDYRVGAHNINHKGADYVGEFVQEYSPETGTYGGYNYTSHTYATLPQPDYYWIIRNIPDAH